MPFALSEQKFAMPQIDAEPDGFDHTATDFVFEGIVTKQAEMPGPTAWRNSGGNRDHAPEGRTFGQHVEVWSTRRFEGRTESGRLRGYVTESVQHHEGELGIV